MEKENYIIIPEKIIRVYTIEGGSYRKKKGGKRYFSCRICGSNISPNWENIKELQQKHSAFCPLRNVEENYITSNKDDVLNFHLIQFSTFKDYQNLPTKEKTSFYFFNNSIEDDYYYKIKKRTNFFYAFCLNCETFVYKVVPEKGVKQMTPDEFVKKEYELIKGHKEGCKIDQLKIPINEKVIKPKSFETFYSIPFLLKVERSRQYDIYKCHFSHYTCQYQINNSENFFNFIRRTFTRQNFFLSNTHPLLLSQGFEYTDLQPILENAISLLLNYLSVTQQGMSFTSGIKFLEGSNILCGLSLCYSLLTSSYETTIDFTNLLEELLPKEGSSKYIWPQEIRNKLQKFVNPPKHTEEGPPAPVINDNGRALSVSNHDDENISSTSNGRSIEECDDINRNDFQIELLKYNEINKRMNDIIKNTVREVSTELENSFINKKKKREKENTKKTSFSQFSVFDINNAKKKEKKPVKKTSKILRFII